MDGGARVFDPTGPIRRRAQGWIDRRVGESTALRDALAELDGRSFAIRLDGPGVTLLLAVDGGRLDWVGDDGRTPDAVLSATPLEALALARSRSLGDLRRSDARLEGNIRVAEQFAAALAFLSPDPEAELAGWIGDIAAHELAGFARAVGGFAERAAAALERDAAEFLTEEQPMLARRFEVDAFTDAVDDLRDAVDRAGARVSALETTAAGRAGRPAGRTSGHRGT